VGGVCGGGVGGGVGVGVGAVGGFLANQKINHRSTNAEVARYS